MHGIGFPVFLHCDTHKAPAKYRVQIGGMQGDAETLLIVSAYDPENMSNGILHVLPIGGWNHDGSEVDQSLMLSKVLELLERSIRFVEAKEEQSHLYSVPLPKSEVRKWYRLSERQFTEWLRIGKIPCIENEKRTLRLLISEYERLKQEN